MESLLENINGPGDVRALPRDQLQQIVQRSDCLADDLHAGKSVDIEPDSLSLVSAHRLTCADPGFGPERAPPEENASSNS